MRRTRVLRLLLAMPLLVLPLIVTGLERDIAANPLIGVWKVIRIDVESDPGTKPYAGQVETNPDPLPSQFIFTRSHYSIVWMSGKEAMRAFATRWQPTEEEKLQRFGEVGINTGTYEHAEGRITVYPVVARIPEFMGGRMSYDYRWSGDNLVMTLRDEYSFDDVPAPWTLESGTQIRLTLARIE